jgi:hypothetical protein
MRYAPFCDTFGCTATADYWCAWGCLEQHIESAALCIPCMTSKKEKMIKSGYYIARTYCTCGKIIAEFFYSSVTDKRHVIMGDV